MLTGATDGEMMPKKKSFRTRRIMCRHCISVDDFWLNNAVSSFNNKINKRYNTKI